MSDQKNTRIGLGFGDLNPVSKPLTQKFYDPETTVMGSIREAMAREYKVDSLRNMGSLKGVVLRVDGITAAGSLVSFLTNMVPPSLVQVKVRVPELHAALPEPSQYGDQDGPHQQIIDMYPTFVAAHVNIPKPSPGDIVYVDFGDRENMIQPIYLGRIDNQPTCVGAVGEKNKTGIAGDGDSEAQGHFETDKEFVDSIIPEVCAVNERGPPPGSPLLIKAKEMANKVKSKTGTDLPIALLMSFVTVELAGRTPTSQSVRFEPHIFLGKPSKKRWSRRDLEKKVPYTPYAKRGEARNWYISRKRSETNRSAFERAYKLDPEAAVASTSFGTYQVMGSTALEAYGDPDTFLKAWDKDPVTVSDELALQFFIKIGRAHV